MAAQRLIDLDETMEATREEIYWTESRAADVRAFLIQQPRVDAVEVIRCKDCRNAKKYCGGLYCKFYEQTMDEDDFCSKGKKENEK